MSSLHSSEGKERTTSWKSPVERIFGVQWRPCVSPRGTAPRHCHSLIWAHWPCDVHRPQHRQVGWKVQDGRGSKRGGSVVRRESRVALGSKARNNTTPVPSLTTSARQLTDSEAFPRNLFKSIGTAGMERKLREVLFLVSICGGGGGVDINMCLSPCICWYSSPWIYGYFLPLQIRVLSSCFCGYLRAANLLTNQAVFSILLLLSLYLLLTLAFSSVHTGVSCPSAH